MLSAIASALGGQIVDSLLGKITGVFESYFKKEITVAELREKLIEALVATFAEIEKAHADALAKCYASFMQAMAQSRLMQAVWASVTLSQLFVLFWYQFIVPGLVTLKVVAKYAPAGSTVEWAYLLVGACVGLGPMVLRAGPAGPSNIVDSIKRLSK